MAAGPQVDLDVRLAASEVHATLSRHMLADGFPIVLDYAKSRGVRIFDAVSGRTFLDLFGFFATAPVGLNHPRMVEPAFLERMGRVAIQNPTNSDIYTVEMARFVETFARFAVPPELPHLFFVAGGTLAVENGMKTAMDWKVRKNQAKGLPGELGHQVIHFREAFHGRSGYALSTTNTADPRKHMYFAKLDWPRISNPKVRFPLEGKNLDDAIAAEQRALGEIDAAFVRAGDDICAVLIEPIQAEGGDHHFRPEFHQALRRVADERDVMLIYDEVQAGFGSTGKLWAHQHYGVVPDIVAFGKKTQVCGIMVGRRVEENERHVFVESTRLNSTWGGSLADMVRCTRYMQIMNEEGLVARAAETGKVLLTGLQDLAARYPEQVGNPRGKGLFCAFDLPTAATRDALLKRCFANDVLVIGCGASTVRFRPPLDITAAEVEEGLGVVARSLGQVIGAQGHEHTDDFGGERQHVRLPE